MLAGARGEVGASLWAALVDQGHEVVPVTSTLGALSGALGGHSWAPVGQAVEFLDSGGVDALVNAGGPGDRRQGREGQPGAYVALAEAAGRAGVPAVLISTLRVCEGLEGPYGDDTGASPQTPYGRANVALEEAWLGSPTAVILRLTNYFCAPQGPDSPQALLLPWSLLTEGWVTGNIAVRSGARASKDFVSDADVARAVVLIAESRLSGRIVATVPGARFTMADLTAAAQSALELMGEKCSVTFGSNGDGGATISPEGWLAEHGWRSTLTADVMTHRMHRWLIEWGAQLHSSDERR